MKNYMVLVTGITTKKQQTVLELKIVEKMNAFIKHFVGIVILIAAGVGRGGETIKRYR